MYEYKRKNILLYIKYYPKVPIKSIVLVKWHIWLFKIVTWRNFFVGDIKCRADNKRACLPPHKPGFNLSSPFDILNTARIPDCRAKSNPWDSTNVTPSIKASPAKTKRLLIYFIKLFLKMKVEIIWISELRISFPNNNLDTKFCSFWKVVVE